jgi:hypothetical protein
MIDPAAHLRQWLIDQAGIQAQVSTDSRGAYRVYVAGVGAGIPQADATLMPRKAVVIVQSGGFAFPSDAPILDVRFQLRCYGATVLEAQEVYGAVFDVLHREQNQAVTVGATVAHMYWCELASGPMLLPEPITEWPCVGGIYRALFHEGAIP